MPRLLFEKKGNAVWISHLDLMRLFQRAFQRAGLPLKHTQGFNQRPIVSIALPLSVGVSSSCELLDFDLDGQQIPDGQICAKLNNALIDGVKVLEIYDNGRKIKDLAFLKCTLSMEYDAGVPAAAAEKIRELFHAPSLCVEKKGKNGTVEQDIIPMLRKLDVERSDTRTLQIRTTFCCQNPSLNPSQISAAVRKYLPEYSPDFVKYSREEIFDTEGNIFR